MVLLMYIYTAVSLAQQFGVCLFFSRISRNCYLYKNLKHVRIIFLQIKLLLLSFLFWGEGEGSG